MEDNAWRMTFKQQWPKIENRKEKGSLDVKKVFVYLEV